MSTPEGGPGAAVVGGRTAAPHDARMSTALLALIDGTHLATPDQLPDVVAAATRHLGLEVAIYLVTMDQRTLVGFPPTGRQEPVPPLDVSDGPGGRAFREVKPVHDAGDLWLPVLDGVERLGVLRLRPADGSREYLRADRMRAFTLLVGHLIAVVTPYGDTVTRLRGGTGRTVEAELLWNLLPPLTYATADLVIAGLLEPCERVAGDAFDYAVDHTTAHFAIFDGSGHNLTSGLLSSVALATYRNQRRRGASLVDCARAIDEMLLAQTEGRGYATGILARLDRATGRLEYVNAGHPRPVLLRDGRSVRSLDSPGRPLFGLGDTEVTVGREQLRRGDRVLLYTDGITEARAEDGSFFGLERLIRTVEDCTAAGTTAPETLRLAIRAVLDHQRGVLQDDATMMLVEWAETSAEHLDPE